MTGFGIPRDPRDPVFDDPAMKVDHTDVDEDEHPPVLNHLSYILHDDTEPGKRIWDDHIHDLGERYQRYLKRRAMKEANEKAQEEEKAKQEQRSKIVSESLEDFMRRCEKRDQEKAKQESDSDAQRLTEEKPLNKLELNINTTLLMMLSVAVIILHPILIFVPVLLVVAFLIMCMIFAIKK